MLAVLEDAVEILKKHGDALTNPETLPKVRTLVSETRDWIASAAREWLYDFESICEALGLEPSAVRRALGKITPAAKPEPRPPGERAAPVAEPEIGLNGLTITDATRVYLDAVGKPCTTQQITAALLRGGLSSRATNVQNCVHTQLTVASKRGQVRRLGRLWALPEWDGER